MQLLRRFPSEYTSQIITMLHLSSMQQTGFAFSYPALYFCGKFKTMPRLLRILSAVSALLLSVLPPVAAQHGRTDRIIIHRTNPEGMDSSLSSRNAGAASVAFDTSGIYTWSYPAADSLTLVRKGNFAIPCAARPHMTVFFDPGTSDFYWYDIYSHDGGRIIRHNLISKATDTVITDIRAVINPNSMNIVSEDSIFLLNSNIQRIFLIDSSGETRKTLPLHSSATIFPGGSQKDETRGLSTVSGTL